jgi:hypothetical protein
VTGSAINTVYIVDCTDLCGVGCHGKTDIHMA